MQKHAKAVKQHVLAPEIQELTEVYLESLSCPRSLSVCILMRYREYDQIASIKATPIDYALASDYHRSALASDWLRKFPGLPVTADPEATAKKSWYQSEEECRVQNARAGELPPDIVLLVDVAADFIKRVLGPCPLDLTPRFGPGATASDPAKRTTALDKIQSKPTVTKGAMSLLSLWEGTAWERSHLDSDHYKTGSYDPLIVEGNTFFTVPKTALTHRGCAKGPSINVSYQLAVGRIMRERLKKSVGLDLARGQDRHASLAKQASLDGNLATLDSERASDTMSTSTVRLLLSKSGFWPDLLDSLREPQTKIDNTWHELEKYSAMGNGYTFELETLVFLSLCYAVGFAHQIDGFPDPYRFETVETLLRSGHITVYGDDIIVPSFMARDVIKVLAALGFTVNLQKSYFNGEFRESCGGDFFKGHAVKTAKLEKEPLAPADWFSIHNLLKERFVDLYPCLAPAKVLSCVKSNLPRQYRSMYGPTYLGDRVLHGWYGPQVTARGRLVLNSDGTRTPDNNQWVARLKALSPILESARLEKYQPLTQLAYILYAGTSEAPLRRPTSTLRYDVVNFEDDYYTVFEDYVPRAPKWLSSTIYARFFGILPDGSYVV